MVETRRSSSASKSFSASSSSPELSSHLHSLPSDLRSRSILLLNLHQQRNRRGLRLRARFVLRNKDRFRILDSESEEP
ncbi:hypothetical protein F2Q68_00018706 [Brassica cretica]|uniref:Uncharacterized protein n=1 Tax=Brassica cretica TaxID=69181 RepID=A0A8S9G084_BRACR|nr:hypothetical protein F2Q68_00018706 [Brassica cretica]